MHVLMLASYAPSLTNFRGPLIRDMITSGHQVSVGAPDMTDGIRSELQEMGATVYETPLERAGLGVFSDLQYFKALKQLIGACKPDLVLTYTIKPNIWGAFAASAHGVRSAAMVTGLGYLFTDTGTQKSVKVRVAGFLARQLYRAATARNGVVIFQNPDDRDDFVAAGCIADSSKIRMVNGSGVDLTHFSPMPLPEEPVFLMIARLLGAKGVREYAQAAIKVKKTHPEAEFKLVGYFEGGPDGVTEREVRAWEEQGVEFLGRMEDVRPTIAEARVYVLPSYREGTPRSVLEAMAMGRPIITTDVPGCRETVVDGENGYLVPTQDVEELAERMRVCIRHPDQIECMGAASSKRVQSKYDVQEVNQTLSTHLGLRLERRD